VHTVVVHVPAIKVPFLDNVLKIRVRVIWGQKGREVDERGGASRNYLATFDNQQWATLRPSQLQR